MPAGPGNPGCPSAARAHLRMRTIMIIKVLDAMVLPDEPSEERCASTSLAERHTRCLGIRMATKPGFQVTGGRDLQQSQLLRYRESSKANSCHPGISDRMPTADDVTPATIWPAKKPASAGPGSIPNSWIRIHLAGTSGQCGDPDPDRLASRPSMPASWPRAPGFQGLLPRPSSSGSTRVPRVSSSTLPTTGS